MAFRRDACNTHLPITASDDRFVPKSMAVTLDEFEHRLKLKMEEEGTIGVKGCGVDDKMMDEFDQQLKSKIEEGTTGSNGNGFNTSEMTFACDTRAIDNIHLPAMASDGHFAPESTTVVLDKFEHQLKSKMEKAGDTEAKSNGANQSEMAHRCDSHAKDDFHLPATTSDGRFTPKSMATALDKFEYQLKLKMEEEGKICMAGDSVNGKKLDEFDQ